MAWFDRSPGGKKGSSEDPPDPVLSPVTTREEAPTEPVKKEDIVAYLYKGSRVTGQLTFHGQAEIEGSVEGEILCHGTLTIGEEAEVRAKVSANVVVIRGKMEGDVTAKERVELTSPARLTGNIATPRLVMAEGVAFNGHCSMGRSKEKGENLTPLTSSEKVFDSGVPKLATDLEK